MDEPFSNLNIELRERLGLEVRDTLKSQNIAAILVTHDSQEAFAWGDVVGILNQGNILQWDTPFNLYHEPINRFVADFRDAEIVKVHFMNRGWVSIRSS